MLKEFVIVLIGAVVLATAAPQMPPGIPSPPGKLFQLLFPLKNHQKTSKISTNPEFFTNFSRLFKNLLKIFSNFYSIVIFPHNFIHTLQLQKKFNITLGLPSPPMPPG